VPELKQLKHTNVVQLLAVYTHNEPIYMVMELMKHGSLSEYLRGDGRSLKFPQLVDMGAQIAAAGMKGTIVSIKTLLLQMHCYLNSGLVFCVK